MDTKEQAQGGGMNRISIGFRNSIWLRGTMAAVLLLLLWFAFPTTQAASFDCKKATTSVEQTVCADDELSRLDSTLASVYRSELNARNIAKKKTFEREQGQWRRETRDACNTRDCIRDAYFSRLATLNQIDERFIKNWRYPPYPEIWGYDFPRNKSQFMRFGAWFSPNGDVLIPYSYFSSAGKSLHGAGETISIRPRSYGYREFFSQMDHAISVEEFNRFDEKYASAGSPRWPFTQNLVRFSNGNVFSVNGGPTSGCVDPFTAHYVMTDSSGKILWRRSIVVRKKEPYLVDCKYPDSVAYSISADTSSSQIIKLRDDTFLLHVGTSVIRFDSNLATKHLYDRKDIFIVEYKNILAVIERAKKRCDPYEPCLDGEMKKYLDSLK